MKKISFLIVLLCAAVSLQAAKVGFLLANTEKAYSAITNVYNEAETLPFDAYNDGENHEQSPERKAYEWFNGTYSATKSFYTIYDVEQGRLLSDGKPVVDVLWFNMDRTGDIVTAYLGRNDFKDALAKYVKAGGNLLLTKQAVRMVFEMGRISGEGTLPSYNVNGYTNTAVADYGLREMNGSSGFKSFENCEFYSYVYPMSTTSYTANRQCVWDLKDGETIIVETFEGNHKCKALGMDQNDFENATGFVEFYPNDPFKGTILAMGLNAYEWGAGNSLNGENFERVKKLTQNMLDYLSVKPTDASVNWQGWETAASGYIGGSMDAATAPTAGDHIASVSAASYTSSDANVASVNNSTGAVNYNYFGSATVTSTVKVTGDGQWVPKNVAEVSKEKSVTVSGGSSSATIGYVLTAQQGLNRLSEEDPGIENPDLTTAQWFYTNYVATNRGQFIDPANAIPDAVQTLWIHSDRKNLESETYMTELGGGTFVGKLRTYLAAGKNLFVSKQATRLIGDLQRLGSGVYPTYGASSEGDDSWDYGKHGPYVIGNNFTTPVSEEHSTHAIYKTLGANPTLITDDTHTNRNYVININSWAGLTTHEAFDAYQTAHDCRLLGDWGNYPEKYECGGLVEFYPKEGVGEGDNTFNQVGTIMMLGLAAYQWVNPTDNTRTLTSNILSYLNTTSAPALAWVEEPVDGEVALPQNVSVSFEDGAVAWYQTAGDGEVSIDEDPNYPYASEYRVLNFTREGSVTVTAQRTGDGYAVPRNVTPTSISKAINVATNIYTRDVSAFPNYYGTICLPRAAASYEGATMFRLVDKTVEDGIIIEEVTEMAAGVPYIFFPSAGEVRVTMTGNKADVQPANGLVGRLTDLTLTPDDNLYILAYNKIWQVDESIEVPANRAYIDMSAINAIAPSPSRKRYVINGTKGATALEQTEENNLQNAKILRNGTLYIIKNGVQYNAQGQMIQ